MKVAINIWLLRKKELDGIGVFIKETVSRMIAQHPDVEFLLMCDKNLTEDYFEFPNAKKYYIFPPLRHPLLYVAYMETVVPLFLHRHKPDIFLAPDSMLSLTSSCRQIACIHDLNFIHQPQHLDLKNRIYYRTFSRLHAKKAARIATVSEYTKNDIINTYGIPASHIDVIYLGIQKLLPVSDAEKQKIKSKYTNGREYYFFVGSLHPRKNIKRLMSAFDLYKKQTGSDFCLVLAGNFMWSNTDIKKLYESLEYKKDIIFTGRVSNEELSQLYGGAYCVTFVPTFEGFGLPIVEAFAMDVPLICSNVTSMPEIADDAAILVNPYDIDDIKNAMIRVYRNDNNICKQLIEKGRIRRQLFSWDNTASLLWQTIKNIG